MRTVTYTVKVSISDKADYEAATSTFESYVEMYNEASFSEFGVGQVVAEIIDVEC